MQSVRRSASRGAAGRVTAVLGPTNTGKTHLAVERMLGHRSGMIGCPLRLLAREIYDRIARARGAGQVALVTGEERIVPARPRYWVCTVESMPTDRAVEFVAIDEIQLAADPERGHVFTDRILHARGVSETMLLGASTMTRLVAPAGPGGGVRQPPAVLRTVLRRRAQALPPAAALRRGWRSRRPKSIAPPNCCAGSAAARRWSWARSVRAPATRRPPSTSPARWITWWPPTPSAWA